MTVPIIDPAVFWTLATSLVDTLSGKISVKTKERRFKKIFGVNANICAKLWKLCVPLLPPSTRPVHLLWALYFLKQYSMEEVNAAFAKCDEKTFRKWCWIVVDTLATLDLVCPSLSLPLSMAISHFSLFLCYSICCCLRMHIHVFVQYQPITLFALCHRLCGKIATGEIMAANVLCPSTERTLRYVNQRHLAQSGIHTK
jgi:hypothetical protein